MRNQPLNLRQKAFVDEYIIDFNGTQAAIRAGYTAKTAAITASKFLINPKIQEYLSKRLKDRERRIEIDQDYVLKRLAAIDKMDISDILTDNGEMKPAKEWPEIWRQFISGMDVAEVFDGSGDERKVSGFLKKIKWPDKVKNLELLGKHVQVQAFRDNLGVSGPNGGPIEVANAMDRKALKEALERTSLSNK